MIELNYTELKGRPMRIMWVRRDPTLRRTGKGNIFIKNLHPEIDHRTLYETMAENVGSVLACRIPIGPDGKSKGYGFVHFDLDDDAERAVETLNGKLLMGQEVKIERYKRKNERPNANDAFTNVYVKNFPASWDDARLSKFFGEYGTITNAKLMTDEAGNSKCFAFINFASHEEATAACEGAHGTDLEGKTLYCQRAQSRAERERLLRQEREERQRARIKEMEGRNIFVKNLPDTVGDDKLRELFEPYGTIQSAKVMTAEDQNTSRGFGFVCFSSQEEATKAIAGRNNHVVDGKPLYVAVAQRKEVRQQQLQRHMQGMLTIPGGMPGMIPFMNAPPMFAPGGRPGMPAGIPAGMMPFPMGGRGGRGGMGMPGRGFAPMGPGGRGPMGARGGGRGAAGLAGRGAGRGLGGRGAGLLGRGPAGGRGGAPLVQTVPPQPRKGVDEMDGVSGMEGGAPAAGATGAAPAQVPGAQPLTLAELASAGEDQRKRMLGERLYPLVESHRADMAAKITGMFLELDTNEVLNLIEDPGYLKTKMSEAIAVLKEHGLIPSEAA